MQVASLQQIFVVFSSIRGFWNIVSQWQLFSFKTLKPKRCLFFHSMMTVPATPTAFTTEEFESAAESFSNSQSHIIYNYLQFPVRHIRLFCICLTWTLHYILIWKWSLSYYTWGHEIFCNTGHYSLRAAAASCHLIMTHFSWLKSSRIKVSGK